MNSQPPAWAARLKVYEMRDILLATAHAATGGIAIHLHRIIGPRAPICFKAAVNRGEDIAHVFGQDLEELKRVARYIGVRRVVVERQGTLRQHFDCCGRPLESLLKFADKVSP